MSTITHQQNPIQGPFALLSQEQQGLSLKILSYLSAKDLSECCLVSKLWNDTASDNVLWKSVFPDVVESNGMNKKSHIYKVLTEYNHVMNLADPNIHFVKSGQELIERMEKFANGVLSQQKGVFQCLFPFAKLRVFHLSSEFVYGASGLNSEAVYGGPGRQLKWPDSKEICIFMRTIPYKAEASSFGELPRIEHTQNYYSSASLNATLPTTEFSNTETLPTVLARILETQRPKLLQIQEARDRKRRGIVIAIAIAVAAVLTFLHQHQNRTK